MTVRKIGSSDTGGKLVNRADILGLPEYLLEFYERSTKNLEAEEQKRKLKEFLRHFRKMEKTKQIMRKEMGTLEEKLKEKSMQERLQDNLRQTENELDNIRKRKHGCLKSEVHIVYTNEFVRTLNVN